jgi:hypothetical protein
VSRITRTLSPVVCVCIAVTVLAACGGGGGSPSETVAQVGGYAITKTMLNQWMTEKVGEGYYEIATHRVPLGLVSEPADYPACVASLKAITPIRGERQPQPQPTVAQLMSKCKELYQAIKVEALTFLVSSYSSINFDAAHGVKVSDAEVQQELKRIKAELYPSESQFQQLLVSRRRTLSQELFIVRLDLLQQKIEKKLQSDSPRLYAVLLREAKNATASASCHPGYVVEYCRGYDSPKTYSTSTPAVLLEEIARWRPETSNGFTGVPIN